MSREEIVRLNVEEVGHGHLPDVDTIVEDHCDLIAIREHLLQVLSLHLFLF